MSVDPNYIHCTKVNTCCLYESNDCSGEILRNVPANPNVAISYTFRRRDCSQGQCDRTIELNQNEKQSELLQEISDKLSGDKFSGPCPGCLETIRGYQAETKKNLQAVSEMLPGDKPK